MHNWLSTQLAVHSGNSTIATLWLPSRHSYACNDYPSGATQMKCFPHLICYACNPTERKVLFRMNCTIATLWLPSWESRATLAIPRFLCRSKAGERSVDERGIHPYGARVKRSVAVLLSFPSLPFFTLRGLPEGNMLNSLRSGTLLPGSHSTLREPS